MPIFLLITVPKVKTLTSLDYRSIPEVGEIRPFDGQIKETNSQKIKNLCLEGLRDPEQAKTRFLLHVEMISNNGCLVVSLKNMSK